MGFASLNLSCDSSTSQLRRACGRRLLRQMIEMLADVRGLGGRVGERDRAVEGDTRLLVAAELLEQAALEAEEMEIAGERLGQRLDHRERGLRPAQLGDRDGAIERHDRGGGELLERRIKQIDLTPVGVGWR